jgi:hypothetical protein
MILRQLGGGDEAYVIYAMAEIIGKATLHFYCAPSGVALPYLHTLRKPTTTPTKIAL